ncbi:MAG: hypothetical protein ABIH47_00850 [Candidatus Omnitrophota bacterium]
MKKIALLLVILTLICSGVASAGNGQGHGWGEPAPNSGDGIPDGPGR